MAELASLKVRDYLTYAPDFTNDHYKTLTIACNIAAAVTNVLISVFLVYHLYILKRGDSRTDDIINRLVRVFSSLRRILDLMSKQIAFAFNTGVSESAALFRCNGALLYERSANQPLFRCRVHRRWCFLI